MNNGIVNSSECTGCGACVDICPSNALAVKLDFEGYKRIHINTEKCIQCGKCARICHMHRDSNTNESDNAMFYAAASKDIDNLQNSSSGGIFYELALNFIKKKGVVYGAGITDDFKVKHMRASSIEEVGLLRKSKYIESDTRGVYKQIENDITKGIPVLFSGTGCQIAGLYSSVGRNDLLFTCEVVCHGVPSETVFDEYIKDNKEKLKKIDFRDKRNGWLCNSVCEKYTDGSEFVIGSDSHPFHELYIKGINMRSECGRCRYAKLPRIADITLADFWKYRGKLYEKYRRYGISLITTNNKKGNALLDEVLELVEVDVVSRDAAIDSCRHLTNPPVEHFNREAFYDLLPILGYKHTSLLCKTFERVVSVKSLCIRNSIDVSESAEVFKTNDSEIIYIQDSDKRIVGVVSFDSFLRKVLYNEDLIRTDFNYGIISDNIDNDVITLFKNNPKLERVPILDDSGRLICEVSRRGTLLISHLKTDEIGLIYPVVNLISNNIRTVFVKRPDYIEDGIYSEKQIKRVKNKESFIFMSDNYSRYKEQLSSVIGGSCDYDYIQKLREIPPVHRDGSVVSHCDQRSELVNVIGGERVTANQPSTWAKSVHTYGRCGVFGYAVDDNNTMPSHLQTILSNNKTGFRVTNKGVWGADTKDILNNSYFDYSIKKIHDEDVVLFYMDDIPYIELLKEIGCFYYDTSGDFYEASKGKDIFFDKPGHMNGEGYAILSKLIYKNTFVHYSIPSVNKELIKRYFELCNKLGIKHENVKNEISEYVEKVRSDAGNRISSNKNVGAIVMNCNPFTRGHRYLVETAAKQCDTLIVFVLEEDKSVFRFKDRLEMVKRGTQDLPNVMVVPSGRFILSAVTFPEYFLKEQRKEITIDASSDIKLFAERIAPKLYIKYRFVGTEPFDNVTAQYNLQLKNILPTYGIELIEIERAKNNDGYISATGVRKAINENDLDKLRELVPLSTYECLADRGYIV